jgi:hypothetical protein
MAVWLMGGSGAVLLNQPQMTLSLLSLGLEDMIGHHHLGH